MVLTLIHLPNVCKCGTLLSVITIRRKFIPYFCIIIFFNYFFKIYTCIPYQSTSIHIIRMHIHLFFQANTNHISCRYPDTISSKNIHIHYQSNICHHKPTKVLRSFFFFFLYLEDKNSWPNLIIGFPGH